MLKWVSLSLILASLAVWGYLHFSDGDQRVTSPLLKPQLWKLFEERFVEGGRVVDRENGNISHSEGQGYGMLLAEAAADRRAFDALWGWTRRVLWRDDMLFSWRYEPCGFGDKRCITDYNNATDGEILIAWALLRAYGRWGDPAYLASAKAIADATLRHAVVSRGGRLFLLPGESGFIEEGRVTLNPSYWVFPALEAFRDAGWPQWREVIASGRWLVEEGAFGRFALPADWTDLDAESLTPSEKFDPRYGYNAVRVLLHLAWSREGIPDNGLAGYEAFWQSSSPPPAWISLDGGGRADYGWSGGMAAIATLARAQVKGEALSPDRLPLPKEQEGYFSWALALLTRVAAAEGGR